MNSLITKHEIATYEVQKNISQLQPTVWEILTAITKKSRNAIAKLFSHEILIEVLKDVKNYSFWFVICFIFYKFVKYVEAEQIDMINKYLM